MTERRIADNDLHAAITALHKHIRALAPEGTLDVVLDIRVDGRASLEWLGKHGTLISPIQRFHTVSTKAGEEWVEMTRVKP